MNRRSKPYGSLRVAALLIGTLLSTQSLGEELDESPIPPPLYTLSLDRVSFLLINRIAGSQLSRTGGRLGYEVEIVSEPDLEQEADFGVRWILRTRQADLIAFFQATAMDQLQTLLTKSGGDSLDSSERAEMRAIPALLREIARAQSEPRYDLVSSQGRVALDSSRVDAETPFLLERPGGNLELLAESGAIEPWIGSDVVVRGHLERPGQFTISNIAEKRSEVLEIFVMSHCPLAQNRLRHLEPYLFSPDNDRAFDVEVRYIFYEVDGEFTSLHGTEELEENCVQMRVRELFPDHFLEFFLLRMADPSEAWRVHGAETGLARAELDAIEAAAVGDRERIEQEIAYVRDQNGILDGSPTFYWESLPVRADETFEPLRALGYIELGDQETCHQ